MFEAFEKRSELIQFNVAANIGDISAQTFKITNYFEFYLQHEWTLCSWNTTGKCYFQLIQPSLNKEGDHLPLFIDEKE